MSISILRTQIEDHCRILVFSDINGDLEILDELLQKVKYAEGDLLVFLGDMFECGPEPLKTLQYIMNLRMYSQVYCCLGEKDLIYRELLREDRNEELLRYLGKPVNSIIKDMMREQNLLASDAREMLKVKEHLQREYESELMFLHSIPGVVELPNFVFAHAKILPGPLEDLNTNDVIRADGFFEKGYGFDKYVILGHTPSQIYDPLKIEANPLISENKKLITIDGGLGRRRDGQLNCLVIPDSDKEEFHFVSLDRLQKARILHTQSAGDTKRTIKAPHNSVKVLQDMDDMAYCRHEKSDECFWIPKVFLSLQGDKIITEDITDYQLRLTEGDIVSVVLNTSRGYLVKKDGIVGWYYGMLDMM